MKSAVRIVRFFLLGLIPVGGLAWLTWGFISMAFCYGYGCAWGFWQWVSIVPLAALAVALILYFGTLMDRNEK